MQAVILAAGRGIRMRPFTDNTAKPLLKIAERPLLRYAFESLPEEIDEVIVVIGYLGEQIKEYLGDSFMGRRVRFVKQKKLEGTAKALFAAKRLLKNRFLVLMADDIYAKKDIKRALAHERAIMVIKNAKVEPGGRVILDEKGKLKEVIEGKNHPQGSLVSTGAYVLTRDIFRYEPVKLTDREAEWGLPQTVAVLARDCLISIVEATRWVKITTPEDLRFAKAVLEKKK